MRLPAAVGALIVTAIGGAVALAGEVNLSHPLHQAIVIVAALVSGLVGLYTIPAALTTSTSTAGGAGPGPPFDIPEPLPASSAQAPAAEVRPMTPQEIDAVARRAAELGLP